MVADDAERGAFTSASLSVGFKQPRWMFHQPSLANLTFLSNFKHFATEKLWPIFKQAKRSWSFRWSKWLLDYSCQWADLPKLIRFRKKLKSNQTSKQLIKLLFSLFTFEPMMFSTLDDFLMGKLLFSEWKHKYDIDKYGNQWQVIVYWFRWTTYKSPNVCLRAAVYVCVCVYMKSDPKVFRSIHPCHIEW